MRRVLLGIVLCLTASCSSDKKRTGASVVVDAGTPRETEAPPKLDAFWDPPSAITLADEKKCPDGLWAVFPGGTVPGQTPEEKKSNQQQRAGLAKTLQETPFVTVLTGPPAVELAEYDNKTGAFTVTVKGLVDCSDSIGRVAFALGNAKANKVEGTEVNEHRWEAEPIQIKIPVPFSESTAFKNKNRFGIEARVLFKLGKPEHHHAYHRSSETADEAAQRKKFGIPGTMGQQEDWGAGRLIRVQVQGVRLAGERGKTLLLEHKGAP